MSASEELRGEGGLLPIREGNVTTRRGFLQVACAPLLLSMLGITAASCNSTGPEDNSVPEGVTISGNTVTVDLTKNGGAPLSAAGGHVNIGAADIIAANVGGTIRAFSSVCPHEGRTVNQFNGSRFTCPAHGAQFDTSGQVVRGPARRGLTEYTVTQNGNIVTITMA